MKLLVVVSFMDRVIFNVNLLYIALRFNAETNGASNYALGVVVIGHHLLAIVPVLMWRWRVSSMTYYTWIGWNCFAIAVGIPLAVSDASSLTLCSIWFLFLGLFRLEVPATLSLLYGNNGRNIDEALFNINTSEIVFAVGEVCAAQVISAVWGYPSFASQYVTVANLTPFVCAVCLFLYDKRNLDELAFNDSIRIEDNATIPIEDSDTSKHSVLPSNHSRGSVTLEENEEELDEYGVPSAEESIHKLATRKHIRGQSLISTLILLAGYCSFCLYAFYAYLLAFVLYHARFGVFAFALVSIIFFVSIVLFVWLSFRRVDVSNLAIRVNRSVFVLGVCTLASWFLFIHDKGDPSAGHLAIHWIAMISISYILPAPVNILCQVQAHLEQKAVCYADILLIVRFLGRAVGICAAWSSVFFLHLAPYLMATFMGVYLGRVLDEKARLFTA